MRLIKELIHRRIPHIIGSYLIAGTSLILFADWLVNRYTLPEYYTTLCLFGVIAIMPSVVILAYFHGAPGKDDWTIIEKIGVPVNIIFIFLVLLIGHRSNWWYEEKKDTILRNFYIHVTSNEDYLNNYYVDYGFGSAHFYDENEYFVSSIEDELLDKIKNKLFKNISSEFANQDISIEMSFSDAEINAFNKLYFIKSKLNADQVDSLKIKMNEISKLLSKRIDYYQIDLPDVLIRYLIYKLTDMNNGKEIYFYEEGTVWGESMTETGTLQWAPQSKEYNIDAEGIEQLVKDLILRCKGKISERRYGGIIGAVIEELDYGTVKIRLKRSGLTKNKMKVSSKRNYHWVKGGAEMRIEDYEQLIDYYDNTEARQRWEFHNGDSLDPNYEAFDSVKWEKSKTKNVKQLKIYIDDIKEKINNNFYTEHVNSDRDDVSYYMEVFEVQDSIAYAKIIGSNWPVFKVRENDWIFISK